MKTNGVILGSFAYVYVHECVFVVYNSSKTEHLTIQAENTSGHQLHLVLVSRNNCFLSCFAIARWEEEEEFDALTDYLERKAILCLTPELDENQIDQLRTFITNNRIAAIFSSCDTSAFAERVWKGFDGPPLFRKIRYRSEIDESASAEDVGSFLEQVLQQNWSLDLDAGLAKKSIKAEIILLICKKVMTKQLILECWHGSGEDWHEIDEGIDRSNLVMLTISETTPGESLQWRDLTKSLKVIENVSYLISACKSLSE